MSIYSTLDYLLAEGAKDGRQRGILLGECQQLCKLLLRHGRRAFGQATDEQRALVDNLAEHGELALLEALRDRLPDATGWAQLLDGMAASQAVLPPPPAYVEPFEFDVEPLPPSIDTYASVGLTDNTKMVLHMRFQRLYQADLGAILCKESKLLEAKYHGPVQTAVLLLWDGADGPAMTGEYQPPSGSIYRYHLTRLWEKDVDGMFASFATAMFAPLARFPPERLPEVVRRVRETITAETDEEKVGNAWSVLYSSMGLRYTAEKVNELLADVMSVIRARPDARSMLSRGYHSGHTQGVTDGALQATVRWILALARRRLADPPASLRQTLESIRGIDRLEQIAARAGKVQSWPELLSPS